MLRKLMLVPYFGTPPVWYDKWLDQLPRLKTLGYDFLITYDMDDFRARCVKAVGIDPGDLSGTRKMCDWRPLFGLLFEEEIRGYDFHGFTDQDVIFGRVDQWVTDAFLSDLDVHSNHFEYICGPWTLFRNRDATRDLFRQVPNWEAELINPKLTGWAETSYSRALERSGLRYKYSMWQPENMDSFSTVTQREDGALFEGDTELMLLHFRRTKDRQGWPL